MTCPLLKGGRYERCGAVLSEVLPTLHEREHYCRSNDYTSCPTLQLALRLNRLLEESEYEALWIPPAPTAGGL